MLRYDWRWLLVIVTINRVALMSRTIVIVGVMFSGSAWLRCTLLITSAWCYIFEVVQNDITPSASVTPSGTPAIMKVCTLC